MCDPQQVQLGDILKTTSWPTCKAGEPLRILFAGLVEELMRGLEVIHEARHRVWNERQDFELLATADPQRKVDEFIQHIGLATTGGSANRNE